MRFWHSRACFRSSSLMVRSALCSVVGCALLTAVGGAALARYGAAPAMDSGYRRCCYIFAFETNDAEEQWQPSAP